MWNPIYIVQKAQGIPGGPIPTGEPCLVIRGQDMLAVPMLAHYITEYMKLPDPDEMVLHDLGKHMTALIEWQRVNKSRVKFADREKPLRETSPKQPPEDDGPRYSETYS